LIIDSLLKLKARAYASTIEGIREILWLSIACKKTQVRQLGA